MYQHCLIRIFTHHHVHGLYIATIPTQHTYTNLEKFDFDKSTKVESQNYFLCVDF